MERSRFSEEQIIAVLKEQEAGTPTADARRRHGISSATFCKWKSKHGGLEVSDAFASGRRFRIFAVVDDYGRECVRLIADRSISGARVRRKLDAAVFERMARPHTIVSDNGTELTGMAILRWSKKQGVGWRCIAPESPIRTGSSRASMPGSGTSS